MHDSDKLNLRATEMPQTTDHEKTLEQLHQTTPVADRGTMSHLL